MFCGLYNDARSSWKIPIFRRSVCLLCMCRSYKPDICGKLLEMCRSVASSSQSVDNAAVVLYNTTENGFMEVFWLCTPVPTVSVLWFSVDVLKVQ